MAVEVSAYGLDCHNCHLNPQLQKFRGCLEPAEQPVFEFEGEKLYRCPSKLLRKDIDIFIDIYDEYKEGHLPFPGSVVEQPIKIMQIIRIIKSAEIRVQKEKYKDI